MEYFSIQQNDTRVCESCIATCSYLTGSLLLSQQQYVLAHGPCPNLYRMRRIRCGKFANDNTCGRDSHGYLLALLGKYAHQELRFVSVERTRNTSNGVDVVMVETSSMSTD